MRKILLLLLLVTAFVACDNDSDPNWNNRPDVGDTQNWDVYTITIDAKDWELVGDKDEPNSFYRCIVDDKYLDKNIFDNGSVMVYLVQYDGNTPVQTPLPYVIHKAENNNLWTETYSYDYTVGSLAFYVTYSDFYTTNKPGTYQFKVVMHW